MIKINRFTCRAAALLLCLLLSLPLCISCGSPGGGGDTTSPDAATTVPETEDPDAIYKNLPTGQFDKHVFNILANTSNFALTDLDADAISGDAIGDAIYNRNRLVEQNLDIEVAVTYQTYKEVNATVERLQKAGDYEYDIIYNEAWSVCNLAKSNYLWNLNEYEAELDLRKPWWYTEAVDSIRINDAVYMLFSDMHLMFMESAWGVAFNKAAVSDAGLTSPYEDVENNTWTHEKLYQISAATAADLNSDGMTADDKWGVVTYYGVNSPLIKSAGISLVTLNDEKLLTYNTSTEKLIDVYTGIIRNLQANAQVAYVHNVSKEITDDFMKIFASGNATFEIEVIGGIRSLRSYDGLNFGILPIPKYSSDQESYDTLMAHYAAGMAIPTANTELTRTCTVLENLAAYSNKWLRPAYYSITLEGKVASDVDSTRMLDIIFNNATFELDLVYSIGVTDVIKANAASLNENLKSALDSRAKIFGRFADKVNDYYSAG